MGYSDKTWYVGSSALKYYPCVLLLLMCKLITSFVYLFWLANNNKVKYSEFYNMGENNETWYLGSNALKCVDAHIKYLICVFPQRRSRLYILWV